MPCNEFSFYSKGIHKSPPPISNIKLRFDGTHDMPPIFFDHWHGEIEGIDLDAEIDVRFQELGEIGVQVTAGVIGGIDPVEEGCRVRLPASQQSFKIFRAGKVFVASAVV